MLKCAKCGHKWHQAAPRPEDDFGLEDFPPPAPAAPPLPPRRDDDFRPVSSPSDLDLDAAMPAAAGAADLDVDLDEPPIPTFGARPATDGRRLEIDLESAEPQPIPSMFTSKPQTKGTGFLWFLVLLLALAGAGGGAYYYQDKVVEFWPPAADLLAEAGLRIEKPGAGLELRNAGTPERFVHNDTEVLIVRGIIANVSDRERPVPTMKLVLLDKAKQPVQEKIQAPPVTALDAGGTAGFRIILEKPDPNAVEVNVLFIDQAEAAK